MPPFSRSTKQLTIKQQDILRMLRDNPNDSLQAVAVKTSTSVGYVRQVAKEHGVSRARTGLTSEPINMEALLEIPDSIRSLNDVDWDFPQLSELYADDRFKEAIALASDQNTDPTILDELAKFNIPEIQLQVLYNPNCQQRTIDYLGAQHNPGIIGAAAVVTSDISQVREYLHHSQPHVRWLTLRYNDLVTDDMWLDAIDDSDPRVRATVAEYIDDATIERVGQLLTDEDSYVRSSLVANVSATPDLLLEASKDMSAGVAAEAIKHVNFPTEHLEDTIRTVGDAVRNLLLYNDEAAERTKRIIQRMSTG